MNKTALITGITGQDGSFLAEFLLSKGYQVYGLLRRSSNENLNRIKHLIDNDKLNLRYGDLTDTFSILHIIDDIRPMEIYNLAAQSDVKVSFDVPEYTAEVDGVGVLRILESIRLLHLEKDCKIYQASTSELFGKVKECPQKETTRFYPYSPYACAKQYAYWIVKNYREAYNLFAVNGILFNHESERRGKEFVTRKITLGVSAIAKGAKEKLYLGNLDSKRDWGYAGDYVECMWLMLQQKVPDDFVIATGEQHTVREFCTVAFQYVGFDIEWQGKGINEKGIDKKTNKVVVEVSPEYFRPTDVDNLLGDPSKAKITLGWNPQKTSFLELVEIMMRNDMKDYSEN